MPAPCSPRPRMSSPIPGDSALRRAPPASSASRTTATRRLPYMSPSFPEIGVQIADTSSVIVMTHAVSSRGASRSSGSSAWIGMRMVWVKDALIPANASAAMTGPSRWPRRKRARSSRFTDGLGREGSGRGGARDSSGTTLADGEGEARPCSAITRTRCRRSARPVRDPRPHRARAAETGPRRHRIVNLAVSRASSRDDGPTRTSTSPGSTTRRPSASTIVQSATGSGRRTRADAPGSSSTCW